MTVEHTKGEQGRQYNIKNIRIFFYPNDYIFAVNLEAARSSRNAPLDRAGLKREEELKILYGAQASLIHFRETKIQMKFDKNLDRYQPKYWPSFPLKIKFD